MRGYDGDGDTPVEIISCYDTYMYIYVSLEWYGLLSKVGGLDCATFVERGRTPCMVAQHMKGDARYYLDRQWDAYKSDTVGGMCYLCGVLPSSYPNLYR